MGPLPKGWQVVGLQLQVNFVLFVVVYFLFFQGFPYKVNTRQTLTYCAKTSSKKTIKNMVEKRDKV